ncbi:BrnA antitoxin family protein [Rhodopila sp.]|uniref:BrnA antitoxin family protein n=1 Tax=Rhodopila sp. TaxID=2480087 RepID=UPI003D09C1DD
MAKAERSTRSTSKQRQSKVAPSQARARLSASKAPPQTQPHSAQSAAPSQQHAGWAADLVFDVREPKLAVSLRLDADVLRFFRGFGAGYQTRINEVLKAFMHAREEVEIDDRVVASAKSSRAITSGKRAR